MSEQNSTNHNSDPRANRFDYDALNPYQLKDRLDDQVSQLKAASEELYGSESAWQEGQRGFEGGAQYAELIAAIEQAGDQPTAEEKAALYYMDSAVQRYQARTLIDDEKLLSGVGGEDVNQALINHFTAIEDDIAKENQHNKDLLVSGGTPDDPLTDDRISGINGRTFENLGRNTALIAARGDVLGGPEPNQDKADTVARYMSELVARRTGAESSLDDVAFTRLQQEMYAQTKMNIRAARGYIEAAQASGQEYLQDGKEVQEVILDAEKLAQVNNKALRELQNQMPTAEEEAEADGEDEDEGDEAPQPQTPAPTPSNMPSSTPGTQGQRKHRGPQKNQGGQPTPTTGGTPGTPASSSPTNPTGTGTPAAPAPGNNPGAPANANTQPSSPNVDPKHELLLEAAKARYQATMQDVVIAGARKGNTIFKFDRKDEEGKRLHGRFSAAIREMMELEHPEYLNNPDLPNKERDALINAYYVEKHSALAKSTAALMEQGALSKFNKFVLKHKKGIRLGAMAVGFALGGGVGGAILGNAVTSGAIKFANKSEANIADLANYQFNAGESLRVADYAREQNNIGYHVQIAKEVGDNLFNQFNSSVVKARQRALLGAAGTGLVWGGVIAVGGEVLVDGADYLWNGDGGFMDKLNHLDNPDGATPWRPSAEKPWWMGTFTPWFLAAGGGALAAAAAYKKSKNAQSQKDYDLAA